MEALESLFARALKLEAPWKITKIAFYEDEGAIKVFADFPRGSTFCCPVCGKDAKAYDTTEKEWRHLNFFQYACYWAVRSPELTVLTTEYSRSMCRGRGMAQTLPFSLNPSL